jgi:hypothetical protein
MLKKPGYTGVTPSRLTGHWQIVDRLGVYMQLRQVAARSESP